MAPSVIAFVLIRTLSLYGGLWGAQAPPLFFIYVRVNIMYARSVIYIVV